MRMGVILAACLAFAACTVGGGEGYFHGCLYFPECDSDLYGTPVSGCAAGGENYTLTPGFFAAEALDDDTLVIRIQSSGNYMSETEGIVFLIPDYQNVSMALDGGGSVSAVIPPQATLETLPPSERYEASYFFNDTCSGSTASFTSGIGMLQLYELYRPGSSNETIRGDFDITFQDTRVYEVDETPPTLRLIGNFTFDYARGAPAQHFP